MAGFGFRLMRVIPGPAAWPFILGSSDRPAPSGCSVNGRFSAPPAAGGFLDVPAQDAGALGGNGYLLLGAVGTTANRPAVGDPDWSDLWATFARAGGIFRFLDATLGAWIHADPSGATGYRISATFAAV